MARLEGAYEQISERLSGVDGRLESLEQRMNSRFGQMDQRFMWVIGLIVTSWLTTLTAVLFRH